MDIDRGLLGALGVAAVLLAGATGARAEEFKGNGMFPWVAAGTVYTIEKGHNYFTGAFTGMLQFEDAKSPVNNAAIQCPGYNDIGVASAGYCITTTASGDEVFLTFACKAVATAPGDLVTCEGSTNITGGTGKFAKAKGGDKFTAHILHINADGTTVGYSALTDYSITY
jgi:hypothetical protein